MSLLIVLQKRQYDCSIKLIIPVTNIYKYCTKAIPDSQNLFFFKKN